MDETKKKKPEEKSPDKSQADENGEGASEEDMSEDTTALCFKHFIKNRICQQDPSCHCGNK